MRILVLSDSHGDVGAIWAALEQQPTARAVIFLGDCLRDVEEVRPLTPERLWYTVPGNNDWPPHGNAADPGELMAAGKRLVFTHGHRYCVKAGLDPVLAAARQRQADCLLFGHTHQPLVTYTQGLHLCNPGSLRYGRGTYAVVDITPAGIVPVIMEVGG